MEEILLYAAMTFLISVVIWFEQRIDYKCHKKIGDIGEDIVTKKLIQLSQDYLVEHDVHIANNQIDHLVINHKLKICFVIETKLWGGIISGSHNDSYWQQEKDGYIKYLPNPIAQNELHCRKVRKRYSDYHVYSIIVFINNANVPHHRCISNENELVNHIYKISNKSQIRTNNPD